jgi:hypothetical protein
LSKVTVRRSCAGKELNKLTKWRATPLAALLIGLTANSRREDRSCTVSTA